jgi:hypothetical protein
MLNVLRWVLVVFFSCMALIAQCDQQWEVIKSGSFEGLADKSGTVIIPPVYDAIGWSDGATNVVGQVIGYKEGIKWGLISLKNKKLTPPNYTILKSAEPWIQGAVQGYFSNHLFYGLLDTKGDVVVSFNYFSIAQMGNDFFEVSEYRDRSIFYGVISNTGQTLLANDYQQVSRAGNVLIGEKRSKKKVFDLQGNPILDIWVDDVISTDFGHVLYNEGKYGMISLEGKLKYDVTYKHIDQAGAHPFNNWQIRDIKTGSDKFVLCDSLNKSNEGYWIAHINGVEHVLSPSSLPLFGSQSKTLVDVKGKWLLMLDRSNLDWSVYKDDGTEVLANMDSIVFGENYFFANHTKGWDVYSLFGTKLNDVSYEQVLGGHGRQIGVKQNGYWGWLDFSGEQLIKFKYDSIGHGLTEKSFVCQYVHRWGVSGFDDEYIILPSFDLIEKIGGYYVAHKGFTKKIFTKTGEHIFSTTEDVWGEDLLLYGKRDSIGAVLPSNEIIEQKYRSITIESGYYKFVSGDYCAYKLENDRIIVKLSDRVSNVFPPTENMFLIKKNGAYGFVDSYGKLRIANRYDAAKPFSEGMAAVKLIGKWGFLNSDEQLVIQPFYDEVNSFQDGLSVVKKDHLYGIINKKGVEVIDVNWKKIERQLSGNFVLYDDEGTCGLVDKTGSTILAPLFQDLRDTGHAIVVAKKAGKMGALTYDAFIKYPFVYDEIQAFDDCIIFLKYRLYH